jgi:uncharacterized membrane protein YesL
MSFTERLPPALQVLVRAFELWWEMILQLWIINVLWLVACVTVIFGPPATFALFHVAASMINDRITYTPNVRDFLTAARRYFVQSWLLAIPNILFAGLTWLSLRYYGQMDVMVGAAVSGLIAFVVGAWVMIQLYAVTYLMQQEQKSLKLALRNALFTALASPFYTATLAVFLLLIMFLIDAVKPIVILLALGPLLVLIPTCAIDERIRTFQVRERQGREGR